MRFTTFHQAGQDRLGRIDGDHVIDLHQAQPQVHSDVRSASSLLAPTAETIQLLPACLTLESGEVWMKHGDVVDIELIGLLHHKIQREEASV